MNNDNLEENNKFFSIDGIIGRRGFIINLLIIEIIEGLIWTTPVVWLMLFNPQLAMSFATVDISMPRWCELWLVGVGAISSILYFPNIFRRLKDIYGKNDGFIIYRDAICMTAIIFLGYFPIPITFCKWCSLAVILFLIFAKGKITSSKPRSEIHKFNWGAFLGTWIWGLFNRVKNTALIIPLLFTFSWFPYALICGIKGNEWVMKTQKYQTPENMHQSQSNQAAVWVFLAPVVYSIIFFAIFISTGVLMYKYSKSHPDFKTKVESILNEYQKTSVKTTFLKIELTEEENKFYIEPKLWSKLADHHKKQLLQSVSIYAANENSENKNDKILLIKTMNKTKIYSIFNNEILEEFYINPEDYEKLLKSGEIENLKQAVKMQQDGFKINKNPSLP